MQTPPTQFDLGSVQTMIGHDPEVLSLVIQAFLSDANDIMSRLESYVHQADFTKVQFEAHSLKGISGNLHAGALQQAAIKIETLAKDPHDREDLQTQLRELKNLFTDLKNELKKVIA